MRKKGHHSEVEPPSESPAEPAPEGDQPAAILEQQEPPVDDEQAAAPAVLAEEEIARLEREASEWKDRALRAAADLENFRKRAMREREEGSGRVQAEVLARVLEVVDDLARVAHLDPATTAAAALHEGMLQIERKFQKVLEASGVERIDPVGEPFDPRAHEAVMTMPASVAEADHTVGMVFQYGYLFKGTLLRPARVSVLTWTPPAEGGEPPLA
jgi:molecular chaperone GrpE